MGNFTKTLSVIDNRKCKVEYDNCSNCIHCNDTEEQCILRKCVHAIYDLHECYKPMVKIEYEGKIYIAKDIVMRIKDKDGICSFYGFKEVE